MATVHSVAGVSDKFYALCIYSILSETLCAKLVQIVYLLIYYKLPLRDGVTQYSRANPRYRSSGRYI